MNSSTTPGAEGTPGPVSLRPEQPGDEAFLHEVYASTREEELARTNWDPNTRGAFLDMQFAAMRRGYAGMYPAGEFLIIALGGRAVGRMVLNRTAGEIRVIDLALLPAHRSGGIGTFLMRQVCAEAAKAGKPVRLSVLKNSRAVRWYERLGFTKNAEAEVYDELEWRPAG
ncbi:MAG TPA: GNAT family N-acetyltransferase [Candidatus Binatia bacterium]|jgi:ribosomal protein S18 acetylase RimI-like enzyme|nr:GNAT family N-acetyltransferase [Candidatus Binatia bacterium]